MSGSCESARLDLVNSVWKGGFLAFVLAWLNCRELQANESYEVDIRTLALYRQKRRSQFAHAITLEPEKPQFVGLCLFRELDELGHSGYLTVFWVHFIDLWLGMCWRSCLLEQKASGNHYLLATVEMRRTFDWSFAHRKHQVDIVPT